MINDGWKNINDKLKPYEILLRAHKNYEPKGFMVWLKDRVRGVKNFHNFSFHEDIIRNIFHF